MRATTRARSKGTKRKPAAPVILAPIDFSPESLRALDYAALLRSSFGGKLHIVHAHDVDSSYAVPSLLLLPPVISADAINRHYQSQLKKLATKYSAQPHVKVGRAFDQICQLAAELKAKLIVISTHGRTGWKRLLLGSTAERVVRHASCPVLVVRERERNLVARTKRRTANTKRMKILVPVDFSPGTLASLRYALFFARAWKAELTLLHVVQVQPLIAPEQLAAYDRTPSLSAIERGARLQMRSLLRGVDFKGVPYSTLIQVGNPAQQICQYAEDRAYDLIINATHGHTGLVHVLIGSVAEHVVRHAHCPVLVVPTRETRAPSRIERKPEVPERSDNGRLRRRRMKEKERPRSCIGG
ncbi:MAG: universal stress protein [Chthoniobacterales bacterium]|nr:universal stress protein [Chthoniobacterales bacterium]